MKERKQPRNPITWSMLDSTSKPHNLHNHISVPRAMQTTTSNARPPYNLCHPSLQSPYSHLCQPNVNSPTLSVATSKPNPTQVKPMPNIRLNPNMQNPSDPIQPPQNRSKYQLNPIR